MVLVAAPVLGSAPITIVSAVPEPTVTVSEPESLSLALATEVRVALEVVALVSPEASVPAVTVPFV